MKKFESKSFEQYFLNRSFEKIERSDGRDLLEARPVSINFGFNWGSSIVSLGKTRVATKVSCDIQQPEASRPNEGKISINVELNAIVALYSESNCYSETAILINRMLEEFIKDSECIDLKSLCIVPKKKVWNIRLDISILTQDGNLIDCASIAALVALMHFHRPDVTSTGTDIIIHPFDEKDPLPLTLFSSPVSVSFVTLRNGDTLMDPTHLEEKNSVAQLSLGVYSFIDLCYLRYDYLSTASLIIGESRSLATNYAAKRATRLIRQIKEIVAKDISLRSSKENTYSCHNKEYMISGKITNL